jgi:phosphoglucomutase
VASLLSAEIAARGRGPAELYRDLTRDLGEAVSDRVEVPATPEERRRIAGLSPRQVHITELAGEKIDHVISCAPGNHAPIGGIKVVSANGWFAARPSGTEDVYKIYAESFRGEEQLHRILETAQTLVATALAAAPEHTKQHASSSAEMA